MNRFCAIAVLLIATALISGCAATVRQAVPPGLVNSAKIAGLESKHIRIWGDEAPRDLAAIAAEVDREQRAAAKRDPRLALDRTANMLVISGGGSNGAFGAGLLNGWSRNGTRPEFIVVTGVSTGALIAPFAFLGPSEDHVLKEFYTLYSTKDILTPTVLAGLFGGSAVTSSEPLANLIAKYLTKPTMARVAAEHMKGRRLLIGTTNLDAERPVIWNMGKIATLGTDQALQLFRKILLASASIPGIFPPVMIDVSVNGKIAQEMHVDGGTTDNAILLPIQTNLRAVDRQLKHHNRRRRLFIIVNDFLDPQWKSVNSSTLDIATRSIATLIKQHTLGDVTRLYEFSKHNRIAYNLAEIPASFEMKSKEPFDRAYMQALFNLGEQLGRKGYQWKSRPPQR